MGRPPWMALLLLVQARGYDGFEWWLAVDEEGRDVFAYALMGMGEQRHGARHHYEQLSSVRPP